MSSDTGRVAVIGRVAAEGLPAARARPMNHVSESAALIHRNGVTACGAKNVELLAGAAKLARQGISRRGFSLTTTPPKRDRCYKNIERAGFQQSAVQAVAAVIRSTFVS